MGTYAERANAKRDGDAQQVVSAAIANSGTAEQRNSGTAEQRNERAGACAAHKAWNQFRIVKERTLGKS